MAKTRKQSIIKSISRSRSRNSSRRIFGTNSISTNKDKNKKKNKNKIIEILTLVKNYYSSIKNNIHVNAYERAIYQISKYQDNISSGSQLKGIPGIGKGMIEKIDTILATGTLPIIKEKQLNTKTISRRSINDGIDGNNVKNEINNVLGFGESIANELLIKHGARTIADINKLVKESKLKLTHAQTLGLKYHKDLSQLIPRDEITKLGSSISNIVEGMKTEGNSNYNMNVFLAGSYPSGLKKESKDIDMIIVGNTEKINLEAIIDEIKKHYTIEVVSLGSSKFLGLIKSNIGSKIWRHLDIRFVSREEFPYCWLYYSSGKVFNKLIRERLKKRGYKLNEFGLFKVVDDSNVDSNNNSNNEIKVDLDTEIDLDTKSKIKNNQIIISNDELLAYCEVIERKIFDIAGMKYLDVKARY